MRLKGAKIIGDKEHEMDLTFRHHSREALEKKPVLQSDMDELGFE